MLTGKYLNGVPSDSRAAQGKTLDKEWLTDDTIRRLNGLNDIAAERGQSLAQMAIAWVLRGNVTTALIGASKPSQIEDSVLAVRNTTFTAEELAKIDELAETGANVNRWSKSSEEV